MPHLMNRYACYTLLKNQLRNLYVNRKFSISLRLRRFDTAHFNQLTQPNKDQIKLIAGKRASLIENEQLILKWRPNMNLSSSAKLSNTSATHTNTARGVENTNNVNLPGKRKGKKK